MKVKLVICFGLTVCMILFGFYGRGYWHPVYAQIVGPRTVSDIVVQYGEQSRDRLKPRFEEVGVAYPPESVTFLASKDSQLMEVWALKGEAWTKIKTYNIQAASGVLGPKLREGDKQVPEGVYKIIGLNPNSAYHLSMKINYPNNFDLHWAQKEGRNEPGSNIFIHGKAVSIGCLAMGDDAIEELFILAADVGIANISVVIAPTDPRLGELVPPPGFSPWVEDLYSDIEKKVESYPL